MSNIEDEYKKALADLEEEYKKTGKIVSDAAKKLASKAAKSIWNKIKNKKS